MNTDKLSIVMTENVIRGWVMLRLEGERDGCFVAEKIFYREKVDDPFIIL